MNLMKSFSRFVLFFLPGLILLSCENPKQKEIVNTAPKFKDKEFVSLQKLYSIDITEFLSFPRGELAIDYGFLIDFDENKNMYILNTADNTIAVFNDSGKMINTFGGTGQGPGEFSRSGSMTIGGGKIYVFQFTNSYKVVNLKGEYISEQMKPWIFAKIRRRWR